MTESTVDVHIEPGDDDEEQERLKREAEEAERKASEALRGEKDTPGSGRRLEALERDLRQAREDLATILERESGEAKFSPKEHLHDDRYVQKDEFERARFEANEPPLDIPTPPLDDAPKEEVKDEHTKVKFGL
jgi:hypothetical protein